MEMETTKTRPIKIVKTFFVIDPAFQAILLHNCLSALEHDSLVADGIGWEGVRVVCEQDDQISMIDFKPAKRNWNPQFS